MSPAPEELAAHALDNEEGRLKVAQIYNQVCRFMISSSHFDLHFFTSIVSIPVFEENSNGILLEYLLNENRHGRHGNKYSVYSGYYFCMYHIDLYMRMDTNLTAFI